MILAKAVYDKYLALQAEADAIYKQVLLPRIQEISLRLHKFAPNEACVGDKVVTFSDDRFSRSSSVDGFSIPVEWLFDPDWEKTVDDYLEQRRLKWERESARMVEESNRRIEQSERAELARLMAKYPQK